MNELYNTPTTDTDEYMTEGERIATQFYFGNFSDGVESLRKLKVWARDFLAYLEEEAEERGESVTTIYGGHFSPDFWLALGNENI